MSEDLDYRGEPAFLGLGHAGHVSEPEPASGGEVPLTAALYVTIVLGRWRIQLSTDAARNG